MIPGCSTSPRQEQLNLRAYLGDDWGGRDVTQPVARHRVRLGETVHLKHKAPQIPIYHNLFWKETAAPLKKTSKDVEIAASNG